MKYLVVGIEAAVEITANRLLQSVDFIQAQHLVIALQSATKDNLFDSKVSLVVKKDGLFLFHPTKKSEKFIVFDLEASNFFTNRTDKEIILFFQKTLRFAIRYWNNLGFSSSEKHVQDSTKAVIFPYPFSCSKLPLKIVVEKHPDAKRMDKRENIGSFLLVYKVSNDDGGGRLEEAPVNVFRKAIKDLEDARNSIPLENNAAPRTDFKGLSITSLNQNDISLQLTNLGFTYWIDLLTEDQKKFVQKEIVGPERIEGPAGTGKTLCMVLKCMNNLRFAQINNTEHHALFITHSYATKVAIEEVFRNNDTFQFISRTREDSNVSIKVSTLHEWCSEKLSTEISETEFIDRDAMESKETQLLYVNQALNDAIKEDFSSYRRFMSPDFVEFIEKEDKWNLSELFQHEISVIIKGRADENLDNYKSLSRLEYGLPAKNDSDLGFAFSVFTRYRNMLSISNQFDTDDVILSAIGPLNTPIWRRRRAKEGYDSIFIDETHLFNLNELSVFHHLTKPDKANNIVFCMDKSQATGDTGLTNKTFEYAILKNDIESTETKIKAIFRCSPDIINLAFSVTSSGATLFTNFDNPLELATSTFTETEERMTCFPIYHKCENEQEMIEMAFKRAEIMARELGAFKSKILVVPFSLELVKKMEDYARKFNKPIEILKHRGDFEVVKRAERGGRYILGAPDYIGGLEFYGVILVGVDDGRVPPTNASQFKDSLHFLSYSAHNRLYVAITRARFRIEILGDRLRGPSPVLNNAIKNELLLIQ